VVATIARQVKCVLPLTTRILTVVPTVRVILLRKIIVGTTILGSILRGVHALQKQGCCDSKNGIASKMTLQLLEIPSNNPLVLHNTPSLAGDLEATLILL
jgi:hypothetical protein